MTNNRIAIIGAGWAGMSAAVELANTGIPVTVFEASACVGGRARRVDRHGLQLDNGQHLLLGAYKETRRMIKRVGFREAECLLRLPLRLHYPGQLDLTTPRLPAPLHLLAGLLTAKGLSGAESVSALRLMLRLRNQNFRLLQDESVACLLAGQPEKLVKLLWEPLCLAALNTPIRHASAQVFLNVLRDSFSHSRSDSDLLLPRTDLSSILPEAAMRFIVEHGGQVCLSSRVTSVKASDEELTVNGKPFSHVICAVAPHQVAGLMASIPQMTSIIDMLDQFSYQPIATVYLQYPSGTALTFPMIGMSGGYTQWVFDRGTLCGQHGLLACVISAEGPHMQLDREVLASRVHGELQNLLGILSPPVWQQVIIEKRATFAAVTGLQRPDNTTAHERIFLAGDYTAGDYPATLEAAVRSGVQCAHTLIATLQ